MAESTEVDRWFDGYSHPARDAMLLVRKIILSDGRISETIKWKSPTFMYKGNLATFNPNTKSHVSLMFHTGASIPGEFSRLQGEGNTSRYMKFSDLKDVESCADELRRIVGAWCDSR